MTQIDKKLIIGIIFISLILISGIILIMSEDSSQDEPEIIEDENLTKSDIAHNTNENINTINAYNTKKDISLSNESNNIQIESDRTYNNELSDSYIMTTIQLNDEVKNIEMYNFQNTQYSLSNESSSWNVISGLEQDNMFEYLQIIDESNIDEYDITRNEDTYVFESRDDIKAINVLNNVLNNKEIDNIENFGSFSSASNTHYTVTIDNSNYQVKSIDIQSEVKTQNVTYDADISISNVNKDVESIILPEELSSTENIISNEYYSFLNISQTTDNSVQINIEEDVSDIVENIEINTKKNVFYLDGVEGDSITLTPNEDFDLQSPNIRIRANMVSGDIRSVGEYRVSGNIDTMENEEE